MRVTVQRSDILPVLSRIQGITGRKTNLAITTNVLIRVTEAGLSLCATDLETGFFGHYAAVVDSPGSIAINSRKLFEIVKDFPENNILINEIENHWIKIGNETVEYHIVGLNPEDFPEIPKIEHAEFFEIPSSVLSDMISKSIIIAAAGDERRTHILGVYTERLIEDGKKKLRMVSTDGSRLCKTDHTFETSSAVPEGPGVLIPKKSLSEVVKFLEMEGNVQMALKDSNLIVKKQNETIIIRLLEGEFPKYSEIIIKPDGNNIVLNRQMFLMMLRRMSILSSDEYKGVIFNFDENKLTISSANPEIGESKEEMPMEFNRKVINVMFNPKFFIDTMNVIADEKIVLNIVNSEKPCLIEGEQDKSYLSVIMPMRT
ncbi:MAG: DNA polymerase III subunit beta [Desulfobacterales bacterium]